MENIIILGSGIAGISAGYHLSKKGEKPVVFEKNDDCVLISSFILVLLMIHI